MQDLQDHPELLGMTDLLSAPLESPYLRLTDLLVQSLPVFSLVI